MDNAKPTSVSPSHAPMTWPPIFGASEKIRSGTSSASLKPHTSFCNATHARNSSSVVQLRSTSASTVTASSCCFDSCHRDSISSSEASAGLRPCSRSLLFQIFESGGETCGSSCARPTQDRATR